MCVHVCVGRGGGGGRSDSEIDLERGGTEEQSGNNLPLILV